MPKSQYLMDTVARLPINIVKAEGSWLIDDHDQSYIDFFTNFGTISLGYANKETLRRIVNLYLDGVPHQLPDLLPNDLRNECAKRLCRCVGMDKVFFCNSGSEANETAIKLARKYQHDQGRPERFIIYSLADQFHGRTAWALAATDATKAEYYKTGFGPMPEGFKMIPDLDPAHIDVQRAAALIMAPVLANHSIHLYNPTDLFNLVCWCRKRDIPVIFDEVQVGMGRCGDYTAYQALDPVNLKPDILTLGKGMAQGFPMAACLSTNKLASSFTPGVHFSTFGGSPFVCAMNLMLLDWLRDGWGVIGFSHQLMRDHFNNWTWLKERAGIGVHWAILPDYQQYGYSGYQFAEEARRQGVMIATFREFGPIRITPPLNIEPADLERGLLALTRTHEALKR